MNNRNIIASIVSAIGLAALALPGLAAQPTTIDFSGETVGAEPTAPVPVVGILRVGSHNGKKSTPRRRGTVEGRAILRRYRRQGARALWRALRGISRPGSSLRLLSIRRR